MGANVKLAASIRQRLLNLISDGSEDILQVLVKYSLFRTLYRLA
jgi:hypothetical protein